MLSIFSSWDGGVDTGADCSSHQLIFEPSLSRIPIGRVLDRAAKDKSQTISGFVSVLLRHHNPAGPAFLERRGTQRHYSTREMSLGTQFRAGQIRSKGPRANINCPLFQPSSDPRCGFTHQAKRRYRTVEIPDNTCGSCNLTK